MDLISTEELQELIKSRNELSLSLFMPAHKTGSGMMQDPIRFKNLIRKAADTLRSHGLRNIDKFLEPLQDRVRDQTFWQYMSDGLAVFRSSEIVGNTVDLVYIPEPGSAVSLLGGLSLLLGVQRFRRRSAV